VRWLLLAPKLAAPHQNPKCNPEAYARGNESNEVGPVESCETRVLQAVKKRHEPDEHEQEAHRHPSSVHEILSEKLSPSIPSCAILQVCFNESNSISRLPCMLSHQCEHFSQGSPLILSRKHFVSKHPAGWVSEANSPPWSQFECCTW
jgi:hypothetical protein